jgi:hypothetical protein
MKRYPTLKCLLAVLSASMILFGVTALVTNASPESTTWTVGGPCGATIQACINTAANGDTVLVPFGTYVEFIRINHPVSLIGISANGVRPTIKAPPVAGNIDPVVMIWSTNPMPVIDASTVISNLIITGGYSTAQIGSPAGGGLRISGERCSPTIQNVIISGNTGLGVGGIHITMNAAPQLINLEIKNNTANTATGWSGGGAGLNINGSPRLLNVLVANNQDNTGRGQIEVMSGSTQVVHGTIVGNGSVPGLLVDAGATVYVTNTIVTSHTIGINSTGLTYQNYNLFSGNSTDWSGLVAGSAGTVFADPGFVNPAAGNYHLVSTSRAIDRGSNAGVAHDFDGDARPLGALYDIGFDETMKIMLRNTWTVGGPCGATIQACINYALEEDTILIPSAEYNEALRLEKPVSLVGLNNSSGQRPTIRSSNVPLLVAATTSPAVYITSSTVISNLILTGGRAPTSCGGGLRLAQTNGTASPTLRDLIVTGNTAGAGAGICMYWGSSPVMINVVITGNTSTANLNNFGSGAALNINGSPRLMNVLVAHNQDNLGRGQIEVMGGAPEFLHSTIVGSGTVPAFWIDPSATLYLTNTIVASHTVGITSTGAVVEDYNLFSGNSTNRVGTFTVGAHDVYSAPAFVDPAAGNYRLRATSAAIDRGTNAGVTYDFDGEMRPMGSGYDIGLDEATIVDSDHDGLTDAEEIILGTDPHNPDTDGDGLPDGWEVQHGLNPLNPADAGADPDSDGLSNLQEYQRGTDPQDADTDLDGYSDGAEVAAGTNPLDPNSHPVTPVVINGTIVSPQSGQIFSATQVSIAGTAAASNGIKVVQVSIDCGTQWVTATGTSTWLWSWSTPLEDGVAHTVTVRVRDSVGQMVVLPPVPVKVDRTAPQTSLLDPVPNQAIRTRTYTLTGKVNDGSGVNRVRVSTDNGSTYTDVPWSNGLWSYNWSIPAEDGVTHHLRVIAIDVAGNVAAPVSVPVLVDNVPPTINFNNLPVNGTTTIYTDTFTVIGTSSGASSTTLDLGSGAQSVPVINTVFTRTWSSLITGTYTLRGVVQDTAGNSNSVTTTVIIRPAGPELRKVWLPLVFRNFDPARDRFEEDSPYSAAPLITPDGSLQHRNFYPVNDVDWARLDIPAGTYIINTSGLATNTDTVMRLFASNGVTQLAENDDCTLYTRASCITWTTSTATTLYVQIAPYNTQSLGADRWYDLAVVRP